MASAILGRIIGKVLTTSFKFLVEGNTKKFEYLQLMHPSGKYALAQIVEIERDQDKTIAYCEVIGYRDDENILRPLRAPFEPGTEVLKAEDSFVKETLGLEMIENSAYIGILEGRENLKVYLDLNKMLTKHVSILAKSGAGKSFFCSVILEELLEKKVPIVVVDPHGEYPSLKYPNDCDKERMVKFDVKPKGFSSQIQEFSPDTKDNPNAKPLKLDSRNLTPTEFIHLLPAKLSNAQLGALYSSIKNLGGTANFNELIFELEANESNTRWSLISIMEYIQKLNLFSENCTLPSEIVQPGKASIINLKGVPPEVQEVVVYKVLNDLFNERKLGNIPPFFLVLEEGHKFIPERSYGEKKSSAILRQIFAEGRKFGLGVCLISQRPSMVEKNALSQVTTQVILKVTNPNDLKAISNSVEGITLDVEKEIMNIPIGTAMVTGIVDLPLFVSVRPRMTKHGGESVKIFQEEKKEGDFIGSLNNFEKQKGEIMAIVRPRITASDIKLMSDGLVYVKTALVPAAILKCMQNGREFSLLIDLSRGIVITNIEEASGYQFDVDISGLSEQQRRVFKTALQLKDFKPSDIFAKSGIQFSELYDIINILTNKGHFTRENGIYRISKSLLALSELDKLATFHNIEYTSLAYDEKMEKKCEMGELKDYLNNFLQVKDAKECFLVRYIANRIQ